MRERFRGESNDFMLVQEGIHLFRVMGAALSLLTSRLETLENTSKISFIDRKDFRLALLKMGQQIYFPLFFVSPM